MATKKKSARDLEADRTPDNASLIDQNAFWRHLDTEIPTKGADFVLLVCWFTTGFLDSTIFQSYRTFVSMQTGNTVFIALGAVATSMNDPADQDLMPVRPYGWFKSLLSLVAFVLGSLFFSRLHRVLGSSSPSHRLTMITSFLIQTLFVLVAAILVHTGIVESRLEYIDEDIYWLHLVPIILLSFQAPAQVAYGRAMGRLEVPTVVVTTMIYDFASDQRLFDFSGSPSTARLGANASRNRRFAGWFMLLVGAVVGGYITLHTRHIVLTLWIASAIKGTLTMAFLAWPRGK